MQPYAAIQYDLRPVAEHNRITDAAAEPRNLDAAIPQRSADTGLQNTKRAEHKTSTHAAAARRSPDAFPPLRKETRRLEIAEHSVNGKMQKSAWDRARNHRPIKPTFLGSLTCVRSAEKTILCAISKIQTSSWIKHFDWDRETAPLDILQLFVTLTSMQRCTSTK